MEYDTPYPIYIPYIGPYNVPLGVICQGRVVTYFSIIAWGSWLELVFKATTFANCLETNVSSWAIIGFFV